VELLIASGRDLGDLRNQIDHPAIAIARERKMTHVVWLLNGFKTNPSRTRRELCVRFKCLTELVAELYAVMVFLGDGLLQLKPAALTDAASNPHAATARRFFAITNRLPLELQMILCHWVLDSAKETLLLKDSEAAFKSLARALLLLHVLLEDNTPL